MKNEVILTGKTVEEAMADARARYGAPDKELSFEILEMPKKGFLGFGAAPAKIKVTIADALEDVNLSDLVSELRSMKSATDWDGAEEEEKPAHNRDNRDNRQKKPAPQHQNSQKTANPPKSAEQKPAEKKKADVKPQPEAKPQKEAAPAPKKPQNEAKPQAKPEVKPQPEAKPQPKPEVKQQPEAKPQPKPEVKQQPKAAELDESNLPQALRRPAAKPQQKNPPKNQKKQQPKPQDNRDGETKKKDLLSAVMGIADAKPAAPAPAVTVTPAVMEKAEKPAPAPVETPAVEETPAQTSISEAVDAALAAIDAIPEVKLEFDPEDEEEEAAAESRAADVREEPRVEYVTPAEMVLALEFVNTLLADMKLEARAVAGEARPGEEVPEGSVPARVEIEGEDTGILIGHHGETLDAIQYLMNLSTSRRSGAGKREFVKILLDIGSYREKREETLRTLARRTAARVVKYKRNIVLEPMNPYERRIIHSEIHGIPDVSTHSVGSDENRKIVITYEGADKQERPRDKGKSRSGDRNRRREKGDRSEKGEKGEKPEKAEKSGERAEKPRRPRPENRQKPARAKSIDEVRIDLSSDSEKTFGSLSVDEGVETGTDPIEAIAREKEEGEEQLREY